MARHRQWQQRPRDVALWVVLAAFVFSRLAYYAAGLRFDSSPVLVNWQIIDPVLMRTDLLRSLWYLHMQPPGFNAWLGLCVKLFPNDYGAAIWVAQLIMGAAGGVLLLKLLRWFGLPQSWACVLTVLFLVSPACVLYENQPTYEYFNVFLALAAAVSLTRFCDTLALRWSMTFHGCLLALALIRNSFHLIFLCAVGAALWWLLPRARGRILAGLLPLLAIVGGLYLKNLVLFGQFTPSTWTGMQLGFVTSYQLTPDEADAVVRAGVAHPVAKIDPFSPLSEYSPYIHRPAKTGVPILDQDVTSTGHANYNNLAYLEVHKLYAKNAFALWRARPKVILRALARGWFSYFLPAEDLPYVFREQAAPIRPWVRGFDAVFLGQLRHVSNRQDLYLLQASGNWLGILLNTGVVLLVLIPAVILWGALQIAVPRWRAQWTREQLIVLGFMLFTIIFLALVYNLLATSENNRTRFPADPYILTLFGVALARISGNLRRGTGQGHSALLPERSSHGG